jgi:hypothetical protein
MEEKELQAWRDIILTNTVTAIALVKVLTQKGLLNDAEVLKAIEETKAELAKRKTPRRGRSVRA